MSHRSINTVRRPDLHVFQPAGDDPRTCSWVGPDQAGTGQLRCILPRKNSVHDPELLAARDRDRAYQAQQVHNAQEAHRARTGEHDDEFE